MTVAGKAGTPIRILAVLDDGNFNANASGLFASAPNNENTQQFTFTTREECEEKLKVLIAEMKKEIAEIKAGEKAKNKG